MLWVVSLLKKHETNRYQTRLSVSSATVLTDIKRIMEPTPLSELVYNVILLLCLIERHAYRRHAPHNLPHNLPVRHHGTIWRPKRMPKNTDNLVNAVLGAHKWLAQNHLALPGRPPELLKVHRLPSMCMVSAVMWATLAASESLKIG